MRQLILNSDDSALNTTTTLRCDDAGMSLGMVMQLPDQDDETSVSRRQLLAKLDVCMGGRVAEELIFGESNITTGVFRLYISR